MYWQSPKSIKSDKVKSFYKKQEKQGKVWRFKPSRLARVSTIAEPCDPSEPGAFSSGKARDIVGLYDELIVSIEIKHANVDSTSC